MARNRITCHVAPEEVFAALSHPPRYADFVVGTKSVRWFDPRWPEAGAAFHHSLGLVVPIIRDRTESLDVKVPVRLALSTRLRPLGTNETTFSLTATDAGTLVELEERPVAGPAAVPVLASVVDRLLWLRNGVVLRRLRTLVESRQRQPAT